MGSNLSLTRQDSVLNEPITSNELDLIKLSWEAIPNKEDFGVRLMIKIFTSHEEIKTEQEMLSNSQLAHHAKKVIDSLNKIINSLVTQTNSNIDQDIMRLGRTHFHHGVKKEYFEGFEQCLLFCLKTYLPNKMFTSKTKLAWRKAIKVIFVHFGAGIEKEEKEEENYKLKQEMKEKAKQK